MKIPVVTGTGERLDLDSDDYPRMVLAEVCADTDPRMWELFAESSGEEPEPEKGSAASGS